MVNSECIPADLDTFFSLSVGDVIYSMFK